MYELVVPTALGPDIPLRDMLRAYGDAGLTAVELWGGDRPDLEIRDRKGLAGLRRFADGIGIHVRCMHARFDSGAELGAVDPDQRAAAVSLHGIVLEAAAELGAQHVVVHPGHALSPEAPEGLQLAAAREGIGQLAEAAERVGVRLAVENLPPGYPASDAEGLQSAVAGTDPEVVGFCLDTGHANMAKIEPGGLARALGSRLIAIHIHDNYGQRDDHLLPGLGAICWPPFLETLGEIGYARPITVEAYLPEAMTVAEAAQHVRRLLGT